MEENTEQTIKKEIKMDSGETIRILVQLVNVKRKNNCIVKDFLKTMFKEIKELF